MKHTKTDEVYVTKNYKAFTLNSKQPPHRTKPTQKMMNSLRETEGNRSVPIVVNRNTMMIIDGMRRWKICEALNLPLFYILVDDDENKLIKLLNANMDRWTTRNHIESTAMHNNEYKKLYEFIQREKSSFELVRVIGGINVMQVMEESRLNLDYTELEKARKTIAVVTGLFDLKATAPTRALGELYNETSGFNLDKLIEKLNTRAKSGEYDDIIMTSNKERIYKILRTAYRSRK